MEIFLTRHHQRCADIRNRKYQFKCDTNQSQLHHCLDTWKQNWRHTLSTNIFYIKYQSELLWLNAAIAPVAVLKNTIALFIFSTNIKSQILWYQYDCNHSWKDKWNNARSISFSSGQAAVVQLESKYKQGSIGHQPQWEHALQIRMCHHQHKQHISTSQGFASLISSFRRLILFEPENSRHTQIEVPNSGVLESPLLLHDSSAEGSVQTTATVCQSSVQQEGPGQVERQDTKPHFFHCCISKRFCHLP